MNNKTPLLIILCCLASFWLTATSMNFMTIDLELSNSTTTTLDIYESGTVEFSLTNNSSNTATGIVVTFSKNQINIVGMPTASLGTPQQHWTDMPYWEIPNLGAGQTATIELPVFVLGATHSLFAEVTAQNEMDIDSTPNNGNSTTPVEDDEASFPGMVTSTPMPDLTISNFNVPASGVINTIVDYTIDIANVGTAGTGDFNVEVFLSIDNILDNNDNKIGEILTGNFDSGFAVPNVTDELDLNGVASGNYFLIAKVDGDEVIEESNETNNLIVQNFNVTDVITGGEESDLELSMTADNTSPGIYNTTRITMTLRNNGPSATSMARVIMEKIDWVIAGDGNVQVSNGNFSHLGSDFVIWYLGDGLAVNQSATVSFDVFTLTEDSNPYAQVTTSDQPDPDSTPYNGTPPQVNEDDEANLRGSIGTNPVIDYSFGTNAPNIQNPLFTNERADFNAFINRTGEEGVEGTYQVVAYISQDNELSADDYLLSSSNTVTLDYNFTNRGIRLSYGVTPEDIYGDVFLILILDPDNLTDEIDETNNQYIYPLTIIQKDFDSCAYGLEGDLLLCTESGEDAAEIYVKNGTDIVQHTIGNNGQLEGSQIIGTTEEESLVVDGNQLIHQSIDGAVISQTTIPQSILNAMPEIQRASFRPGGGYVFVGTTTDNTLNVITTNNVFFIDGNTVLKESSGNDPLSPNVLSVLSVTDRTFIAYVYGNVNFPGSSNGILSFIELTGCCTISEVIPEADSSREQYFYKTPCNSIRVSYKTNNVGQFGGTVTQRFFNVDASTGMVVNDLERAYFSVQSGDELDGTLSYEDYISPNAALDINYGYVQFAGQYIYDAIIPVQFGNSETYNYSAYEGTVFLDNFNYAELQGITKTNQTALLINNQYPYGMRVYAHDCDEPTTGSNGTDIALTLAVDNSTPSLWSNITYTLTATNLGDESASGLIVDFDNGSQISNKPLAFVSNDNTDYDSWNGIWTIGNLAPGESMMVNVELFVLEPALPSATLTAFVSSLNEMDSDSSNDESSATIMVPAPATIHENSRNPFGALTGISPIIQNLYPNPAQDQIELIIESPTAINNVPVMIVDGFGKFIIQQNIDLTTGVNVRHFDIGHLPEEVYSVYMNQGQKGNCLKRFVKVE